MKSDKWVVKYTESYKEDLLSIYDYISDVILEPEIAEKLTNRIHAAADSLDFMPLRYQLIAHEPWRSMGWRIMPVENYLVFYVPCESSGMVEVMRVIYSGRKIEEHLDS